MSYLKKKPRKLADGTERVYWYRCEAYRDEQGRPREKVVEYIGPNPNVRTFPLDALLARQVAPVVAQALSPTDMMNQLKALGFEISFRPRQVGLLNTPPLRRLTLRIE